MHSLEIFSAISGLRFPNDGCIVIGGSKNGTCYTPYVIKYFHENISFKIICFREECTGKGGTASGTCASGFGVCCTSKLQYRSKIFLSNIYARRDFT